MPHITLYLANLLYFIQQCGMNWKIKYSRRHRSTKLVAHEASLILLTYSCVTHWRDIDAQCKSDKPFKLDGQYITWHVYGMQYLIS